MKIEAVAREPGDTDQQAVLETDIQASGAVGCDRVQAEFFQGDAHIDAFAKKYLDADSYPYRQEGEQRIKFTLRPERVHYVAPMH